jgi:hypothetical protein
MRCLLVLAAPFLLAADSPEYLKSGQWLVTTTMIEAQKDGAIMPAADWQQAEAKKECIGTDGPKKAADYFTKQAMSERCTLGTPTTAPGKFSVSTNCETPIRKLEMVMNMDFSETSFSGLLTIDGKGGGHTITGKTRIAGEYLGVCPTSRARPRRRR